MKRSALLAFTLIFAPTLAWAQQPPPGPPPNAPGSAASADSAADRQRFAAMQQVHQQMQQIHQQARAQILAALSAPHRTMIASTIGGLAVASNPDTAAAARQIDALLSPAEKQAVLSIHATTRTSMLNLMQSQRAQFEAAVPADQRAKMQQRDAQRQAALPAQPRVEDAGAVVLHVLGHFGGMGDGMGHGMHRP